MAGQSSASTSTPGRSGRSGDTTDADPVGRAICALWSDWLPAVTGEVLHVDGGMRAMGAGGIRQARVSAPAAAGRGADATARPPR
ncbi:SDR family oxidoreductase [Micromonospora sp. DT233]|uniref:SDR family oxidoreductase n=1 Tax=Micromonospora sp. DT233 TaxID=3393432 RepID=UPI003CFB6EBC